MKRHSKIIVAAFLLCHLACGSDEGDVVSDTPAEWTLSVESEREINRITSEFMTGRWISSCEKRNETNGESYYHHMVIVFKENNVLHVNEATYSARDCQFEKYSGDKEELKFFLGEPVLVENEKNVRKIDFIFPNGERMLNIIQRKGEMLRIGTCDDINNKDCEKYRSTKLEDKFITKIGD